MMKELKDYKTELLINYLNKRIDANRRMAEDLKKSGDAPFTVMSYVSRASELDCALAYLMGLMYGEGHP